MSSIDLHDLCMSVSLHMLLLCTIIESGSSHGARNKDQKLVGRFLKIGYFIGYFTAVPLKMYGKHG